MMTKMHLPPPMPAKDDHHRSRWLRLVAVMVVGVAAYGFVCAVTGVAMQRPLHELMRQLHG